MLAMNTSRYDIFIFILHLNKEAETTPKENGDSSTKKDEESSRPARKAVKNDAVDKKVSRQFLYSYLIALFLL